MQEIKVNVSADGSKVKIGVNGVAGESCTELTKGLEARIFGDGTTSVELTDEYYQDPEQGVTPIL